MPPATKWLLMLAMALLAPQLWPPLVELNTPIPPRCTPLLLLLMLFHVGDLFNEVVDPV
jgi:hypothetical protein